MLQNFKNFEHNKTFLKSVMNNLFKICETLFPILFIFLFYKKNIVLLYLIKILLLLSRYKNNIKYRPDTLKNNRLTSKAFFSSFFFCLGNFQQNYKIVLNKN